MSMASSARAGCIWRVKKADAQRLRATTILSQRQVRPERTYVAVLMPSALVIRMPTAVGVQNEMKYWHAMPFPDWRGNYP